MDSMAKRFSSDAQAYDMIEHRLIDHERARVELIDRPFTSLCSINLSFSQTIFSVYHLSVSMLDTIKNTFLEFGDTVSKSTFGRVFRLEGSGHVRSSNPSAYQI